MDPITYAGVGLLRRLVCALRGHDWHLHRSALMNVRVQTCRRCGRGMLFLERER